MLAINQWLLNFLLSERIKTFWGIGVKESNLLVAELQKRGVLFGFFNGLVDCLYLPDGADFPDGVQCRYILTKKEFSHKDFEPFDDDNLIGQGYRYYKRRDLKRFLCYTRFGVKNAVYYYRIKVPMLAMWERYIDIDFGVTSEIMERDFNRYDAFIFHRYIDNNLMLAEKVKKMGKKVVYDTDDNEIIVSPVNPLYKYFNREEVKEKLRKIISIADLVTVTTNRLKKELEEYNKNIVVLKNKIDLLLPVWNFPPKNDSDEVVIGYVGGPTHKYDLMLVLGAIVNICQKNDKVKFMLCGYTKGGKKTVILPDGSYKIENLDKNVWDELIPLFSQIKDKFIVKESLDINLYPQFFQNFDIVIAPAEDNRFNNCKSELKVVEAGAASLPIVCSDIEPYRIIKHGEEGFLAKNGGEFYKYLNVLIKDRDLRKKMGSNLRKKIEREYDANNQQDRHDAYLKLFNGEEV